MKKEPLLGVDDVTADVVPHPPRRAVLWARRIGYTVLALVLAAAALNLLGPREGHTSASGGGYELGVDYPQVTRAGQPSPLRLRITASSGFGDVVQVRLCRQIFEDIDFQSWYPNPSAETSDGTWIVYEFDSPPTEDTLEVTLDARTAPGQFGALDTCEVAVLQDDAPVVSASFTAWRLP